MKYRAKCTWCEKDMKTIYQDATFVTDATDVYIEVDTEDEAEAIEALNRQSRATIEYKRKVLTAIINRKNNCK